ncbi:MAG TPA: tRNA (guanosine(37)-N1)-methyltransferase TrmD, partial [Candidatus Paceibacterota bacterium]|nr:tRNA (guanosine(37)-N1)-methyltransferase TrmD [Candidatus Paceibacterota bacterium]
MLSFDILTVLPESLDSYINTAIVKRAIDKKKIKIQIHNLRDWSDNNYKSVDDHPYGGGAGMVMRLDIIFKALKKLKALELKKKDKTKVILFAANGAPLTQRKLEEWSKLNRLVLICGRYEGIDNRVAEHLADEAISIGPYVLTGGEIPALTVIDGVTRLLPEVIKKES